MERHVCFGTLFLNGSVHLLIDDPQVIALSLMYRAGAQYWTLTFLLTPYWALACVRKLIVSPHTKHNHDTQLEK